MFMLTSVFMQDLGTLGNPLSAPIRVLSPLNGPLLCLNSDRGLQLALQLQSQILNAGSTFTSVLHMTEHFNNCLGVIVTQSCLGNGVQWSQVHYTASP